MIPLNIMECLCAIATDGDELQTFDCNMSKLLYYSLFAHCFLKVIEAHMLSYNRSIELLTILVVCNGPDKMFYIMREWEIRGLSPGNLLFAYVRDCLEVYNNVSSGGASIRHQPSAMRPINLIQMLTCARVLKDVIDRANAREYTFNDYDLHHR